MSRAGGAASVFRRAVEYLTMGKFVAGQSELPRGLGREPTSENTALLGHRFPKTITVAWLTVGIASVALASIAALVLRSERESTAILHHLNVISLNLQHVLSDLADAEAEAREYVLTGRGPASKIPNSGTKLWLWLVIDTIGFNGRAWATFSGLPTTEGLHVVERFRRIDLGHLEKEVTIDDPGAYLKPWTIKKAAVLAPANYEIQEYVCNENNRDVEHSVGK